jgi:hypothetical protein
VLFGFGRVPADLALSENLDRLNFRELPAGTALGTLGNGVARPLVAVDTEGADVTDQYFRFDRGQVRTRREVMPSMLTLDHRIIRQDCLCYLMERIHFEDNEEVTGIDPLPDSLPRHD